MSDELTPKHFHLKQYEMLRAEVMECVAETRKLELTVAGAIGVYYAWAFNQSGVTPLVWLVPPALVLLAGFRAVALFARIGDHARYLRGLETALIGDFDLSTAKKADHKVDVPRAIGWEFHRKVTSGSPLLNTAVVYWIILLIVTTAIAYKAPTSSKPAEPQQVQLSGELKVTPK